MFEGRLLAVPRLRFGDDASYVSSNKLNGLQRFGPYRAVDKPPTFAFVFPQGKSEAANVLFRALARGVDLFKGMPTVFRVPITADRVSAISGFSDEHATSADRALAYAEALRNWLEGSHSRPDFVFLLHERTPEWEVPSSYHACKRLLLEAGIVSQSVTFDLIANPVQFGWAAANIALATFCKLGGTPWIVDKANDSQEVVIGVGSTEFVDPVDRSRRRRTAFTTCLESRGEFQFTTVGTATDTKEEYLESLSEAVTNALNKALALNLALKQISIFVTKRFSREEMHSVASGVESSLAINDVEVCVSQITDEPRFFLVDGDSSTGLPPRGLSVQLSEAEHLLYTEGADDTKAWRGRTPAALRVRQFRFASRDRLDPAVLDKVLGLSQVNFRGFNAVSRPAVLVYSERTARLLECGAEIADAEQTLNRMWFL